MRFHLLAVVLLLSTARSPALAGDSCQNCKPCRVRCPRCSAPCQAKVTEGTKTKHCYGVQCKKICIPKVTFPWQRCQPSHCGSCATCDAGNSCDQCAQCPQPRCGRSKYVKVLMKHVYECPVCKYSFDPVECAAHGNCSEAPNPPQPQPAAKDALQLPPLPSVRPVHTRQSRVPERTASVAGK